MFMKRLWLSAPLVGILTVVPGALIPSSRVPAERLDATASRYRDASEPSLSHDNAYQVDLDRLSALRSHSLDEVLAFSNELERKWRSIDWNSYAQIMIHVCSEISNRGVNDLRLRHESENFARLALSHSNMFAWEHEARLVDWLGYRTGTESGWVGERREKAELWLRAWRRLANEFDPSFDVNDPKNRPSMRVYPPAETRLPPGTPPSAIKDPRLRAEYKAAIAENERKTRKANQQIPLLARGPAFKARAEHWLIGAYSQPPSRNAELQRLLKIYMRDGNTRERIILQVQKNSK